MLVPCSWLLGPGCRTNSLPGTKKKSLNLKYYCNKRTRCEKLKRNMSKKKEKKEHENAHASPFKNH